MEGNLPFDRDKQIKSIYIALKKRPIDTDTIEKFITKISRSLEELGQKKFLQTLYTMVMDALKNLRSCSLCKICFSL